MRTQPRSTRLESLSVLLANRIAVLDGAMGTMVHALELDEKGFRGERFRGHSKDLKNCIDILTLTQGQAIQGIHTSYLDAGADIVETNTFGATSLALADFGLSEHVRELNVTAARLAGEAADPIGHDLWPDRLARQISSFRLPVMCLTRVIAM